MPVLGTLFLRPTLGEHATLLWLLALIPVFPLAYDRGLRGALWGLGAGLGMLVLAQLTARTLGLPTSGLLVATTIAYVGIALGVGWVAEILHRRRDQVEDLAFTDLLTGLPNRRHAGVFLDNEFAAAERGRFLSVVLFDLDRFKDYNDAHGHQAGDEALELFAEVLSRQTRRMNLSSRFGGEEFLSVLAASDLEGAYVFAERVRTGLRARNLGSPPLTVSAGVAEYNASMRSPGDLLAAADQALYEAKKLGRNCVRVFGHPDFRSPAAEDPARGQPGEPVAQVPASERADEPAESAPEKHFGVGRRVLLVDDDEQVRRLIATSLARDGFSVVEADDVPSGLAHLEEEFDVVLADILLPGANGDRLVAAARARWPATQVVVVTGLRDAQVATAALNAGADRYLFKPFGIPELRTQLSEALLRRERVLSDGGQAGEKARREAGRAAMEALKGAHALVRAAELRERFTQGHASQVAEYARILADALDPHGARLDRSALRLACELHDIGKIAIAEAVLNKEGELTPEEIREVRQHPVTGHRILEPFLSDETVLSAARWHHEWWNGEGYPDGKAGEEIPLVARVVALAEGLSALTRPRAYRGALSLEDALDEIHALSGTQYDPSLVALLDGCGPLLVGLSAQGQDGFPAVGAAIQNPPS